MVEHPAGASEVFLERSPSGEITACGMVRTARKIMAGQVFPAGISR